MAEVFLARQRGPEGFDRRVAVKRILPHLVEDNAFVRMFLDEARLAARLTHPNIVHIYEFGKVEEHYFIAMEYVGGIHAGELIKHSAHVERMPLTLVARIGADACAGLHYAHELEDQSGRPLKVVHRDVSPPNLMISFDGTVKLVDFGIAKAVSHVEQTRPGVVKGKYAYMSPEQTTSTPLDGRSDVFSLALLLWELMAGRVAVSRKDPVEAMRTIRDGRIPSIESARPDVPQPLSDALTRALQVNPADRCSALELGRALEGFIKASPELGTSLELSQWVRQRFKPTNTTGEQAALASPGATRPATAAATAATAAATVATATAASTPPVKFISGVDTPTEVVRSPPSFLPSSEQLGLTAITVPPPAAAKRQWHRIAIAAIATAVVGAAVMTMARSGSDETSSPAPPTPADATRSAVAPLPADAAALALPTIDAGGPTLAAVEVITLPADARVTLGKTTKTTPAKFVDVIPGKHRLHVEHAGYAPLSRELTVAAGELRTLEYSLAKLPAPVVRAPPRRKKGRLTARTHPYSVVYLGRKKLGVTPFANVVLPAGTHTLTFKNPEHKTHRRRVTIRAGKTAKLNFSLP